MRLFAIALLMPLLLFASCHTLLDFDEEPDIYKNCGNDSLDSGEECDGNLMSEGSCQDAFFGGGELSCTDECTFSYELCELGCGNGVAEWDTIGEQCDGEDLDYETCVSQGFPAGGELRCLDDCTFATSNCRDFIESCGPDYVYLDAEQDCPSDTECRFQPEGDPTCVDNSFVETIPYYETCMLGYSECEFGSYCYFSGHQDDREEGICVPLCQPGEDHFPGTINGPIDLECPNPIVDAPATHCMEHEFAYGNGMFTGCFIECTPYESGSCAAQGAACYPSDTTNLETGLWYCLSEGLLEDEQPCFFSNQCKAGSYCDASGTCTNVDTR